MTRMTSDVLMIFCTVKSAYKEEDQVRYKTMTSAWRQRIKGRFSYPSLCLVKSFTYTDITETVEQ